MTQFFTFPHLCCPLDGEPLTGNETSLVCIKGHSFDIARKGYVNLLNVQYKRSKDPGDSKEMVLARRAFLEAGHFAPVSNHMNEIIKRLAHPNSEYSILDAGCGEGYYLDRLYRALGEDETSLKVSLSGVDISKQAIQAAAGRNKEIQWLVASNRQLPIQGETIDTIVCGFGFPVYESFAHVLKS
ncbi:MAG: methyltransferase domain-containing protein, partial [Gammaproteobacteria bacterium]|nr:methyltransferase domain-containing protein [Gammaproteobacteria bacterium]